MGIKTTLLRAVTWWNGSTLGTQLFTWRRGTKVGEDSEGNIYYRNADDSKRWVIFNGEAEASRVGPEWHGWLHRTFKETDLFKVYQTGDLGNLDRSDPTHAAALPQTLALRDALYSDAFRAFMGRTLSDAEGVQLRDLRLIHGLASRAWGHRHEDPEFLDLGERVLAGL